MNQDFERWLYVLDTDWSDLIEISDVTLYSGTPPRLNCLTDNDPNLLPFTTLYLFMSSDSIIWTPNASDVSDAVFRRNEL